MSDKASAEPVAWLFENHEGEQGTSLYKHAPRGVKWKEQLFTQPATKATSPSEPSIKAHVLRNEVAIILGCKDGRSAQEKADAVIAWIDKHDQRGEQAASPSESLTDERAAFESAELLRHPGYTAGYIFPRHDDGEYRIVAVENRWVGWQMHALESHLKVTGNGTEKN